LQFGEQVFLRRRYTFSLCHDVKVTTWLLPAAS
jgi:hypothetical protein